MNESEAIRTLRDYETWVHGSGLEPSDEILDAIRGVIGALDEATELIEELVAQGCQMGDGTLDSSAITTYAVALHWLASRGRVVIDADRGRRVIARWAENAHA